MNTKTESPKAGATMWAGDWFNGKWEYPDGSGHYVTKDEARKNAEHAMRNTEKHFDIKFGPTKFRLATEEETSEQPSCFIGDGKVLVAEAMVMEAA